MMIRRVALVAAVALSFGALAPASARTACVPIRTVADLNLMRQNLAGNYCLMNDLDLSSAGKFAPIGTPSNPFTGIFNGGDHVIRRPSFVSGSAFVGLFGWIANAQVRNLKFAGVHIKSTAKNALAGILAGYVSGSTRIENVAVISGSMSCAGDGCRVGGLIGQMAPGGSVRMSSNAAWVFGASGGASGGLAGQSGGTITMSYATGTVHCGANCAVGGLVGHHEADGIISNSFSVGTVRSTGNDSVVGGIAGNQYGQIWRSYTTSHVTVETPGTGAGLAGYHGGKLSQTYATGRLSATETSAPTGHFYSGGLVALLAPPTPTTSYSYWDTVTSAQASSVQGRGKSTKQLQAALPAGFDSVWRITKGYSYPYLGIPNMPYMAALATVVKGSTVNVYLPINQHEPSEYIVAPGPSDNTSLAAVYTMIVRGVDRNTEIDRYFWDRKTKKTVTRGPITSHNLSRAMSIPAATPINNSNIIGAMKARKIVIIRGLYEKAKGKTSHWMLATMFTTDKNGATSAIAANDPWTGRQVLIDAATKRVIWPADFPLKNFTVDTYVLATP